MQLNTPKIIFQDDSFFVVDKPTGWITNEADTTTNQPVLQTWIRDSFDYELKGNHECRDGIVHRLDKETSGVLVVAKTKQAFEALQKQFKDREVEKSYIALVHGDVKDNEGEIIASVGRLPWRRDRFGVLPEGREATTRYKVIERKNIKSEKYTLLELFPRTGRTHQIRVHLKHIGHPIVSDIFYAGRKTSRSDHSFCPRLFLHAASIKFTHPKTGKEVLFKSDLPKDLVGVLN